jgi:NADH:ubiquinone oxidoreductase subunit 4 (subunit M)
MTDLSRRELAVLAPLVVLTIYHGVHPAPCSTPSRPRPTP